MIPASEYSHFLGEIQSDIRSARLRSFSSLNQHLLELYWRIGRSIAQRQEAQGWGDAVIHRLSIDLRRLFPDQSGFSKTNLFRMRQFFKAYRHVGIIPNALGIIPWSHHLLLLDKSETLDERTWYAEQILAQGWSHRVLAHQIESRLYQRQGTSIKDHNFERTLPPAQSDLAKEILKDPYHFDFLGIGPDMRERDLERALIHHVQEFLLELGTGFAFIGRQYAIDVAGTDYFIDLLFFHLRLRSLIAIDLKLEAFRPEHAGKMNFYLSALDDRLRHEHDSPSIGILLCKEKDRTTVEYALRDTAKPIGVSAYRLTTRLPKELKGILPDLEQFERTLRIKP